jgi:hypothetical protein
MLALPMIIYCAQHAGARRSAEKLKGAHLRLWLLIPRLLPVHLHGLQRLGSRSFLARAAGSACNLVWSWVLMYYRKPSGSWHVTGTVVQRLRSDLLPGDMPTLLCTSWSICALSLSIWRACICRHTVIPCTPLCENLPGRRDDGNWPVAGFSRC